jgi:uncharacterized C2H2 Zn-finger protein
MPSMNCGQCGASLGTIDAVVQHAESAHPHPGGNPSGDVLCPGCPASFREIIQLRRHLSSAHGM